MKAKVWRDGRVTIPQPLREQLGIRPGQVLDFDAEEGRIVASKVIDEDPVDRVYGTLGTGGRTDDFINELRGPPLD